MEGRTSVGRAIIPISSDLLTVNSLYYDPDEIAADDNLAVVSFDSHQTDEEQITINYYLLGIILLVSLSDPITETADMGMSLSVSKNTELGLVLPATVISMLVLALSNLQDTISNAKENYTILKRRQFPYNWPDTARYAEWKEDWPPLARWQENVARTLTVPLTLWEIFSNCIQTFYFVDAIPSEADFSLNGWSALSGTVSSWSALTTSLGTTDRYKTIRKELAGKGTEYTNTFSRFASPVLGLPLGGMKSLQSFVQIYIATKTVLRINSAPGICIVGSFCLSFAFPNSYFDWRTSTNLVNDFFGYVAKRKFEPLKILSYLASLATFGTLEYLKMPINIDFCKSAVGETLFFLIDPESIPDYAYQIIAWAILLEAAPRLASSLQPTMYTLMNCTYNKASSLMTYIPTSCFKTRTPKDGMSDVENPLLGEETDSEEGSNNNFLPPVSENKSAFFNENTFKLKFHRSAQEKEERAQSRRCCILC